jgi:hypothetical protein
MIYTLPIECRTYDLCSCGVCGGLLVVNAVLNGPGHIPKAISTTRRFLWTRLAPKPTLTTRDQYDRSRGQIRPRTTGMINLR